MNERALAALVQRSSRKLSLVDVTLFLVVREQKIDAVLLMIATLSRRVSPCSVIAVTARDGHKSAKS